MKHKLQKLGKGIVFTRTALGSPVFIKRGAKSAYGSISPRDWSISQLRLMADYMEENPKCGLFSDGSGSVCKK